MVKRKWDSNGVGMLFLMLNGRGAPSVIDSLAIKRYPYLARILA